MTAWDTWETRDVAQIERTGIFDTEIEVVQPEIKRKVAYKRQDKIKKEKSHQLSSKCGEFDLLEWFRLG